MGPSSLAKEHSSPAGSNNSSVRYAWYLTFILALAHLVSLVDRHLLGVMVAQVQADVGLNDTQLGLLYGTGFALLYSVVSLPLGQLADSTNRKNLIAAGLALWTLATMATAFSESFASFFFLRMLVGIGEACLVPAGMSLLMTVPRGMLARATAIFSSGGQMGRTVALMVGGPLLMALTEVGGIVILGHHFNPWRGVMLLASLPGLLLLPLLLTLRESRPVNSDQKKIAVVLRSMRPRRRAYFFHFASFTAVCTLVYVMSAWALALFVRDFGLSTGEAGVILGIITLIAPPAGSIFGGWVLDRLNANNVAGASPLIIGWVLMISVPSALLFGLASDIRWAIAAFAFLQFIVSVANAPGWVGTQILTPPENCGVAMALFTAVFTSVSIGIGPPVVGFLSDYVFAQVNGLAYAVMTTLVAFSLLGLGFAFGGRKSFIAALASLQENSRYR